MVYALSTLKREWELVETKYKRFNIWKNVDPNRTNEPLEETKEERNQLRYYL